MISGLRAPFHNDNRTMRVEGSFRDRLQQVGFSDVERARASDQVSAGVEHLERAQVQFLVSPQR